ncbi:hypothetical protein Pcinc_016078 [Petrolisthes cinctipes]|uniref:Secreted protein n=1 Tax=Petrolisthes cinctipes TaxID=88211 RepID=A0AAE1FRQ8_PETCI|nr:hypothetical protein Pcinc_016078 [Petrolisthes cinctipes]
MSQAFNSLAPYLIPHVLSVLIMSQALTSALTSRINVPYLTPQIASSPRIPRPDQTPPPPLVSRRRVWAMVSETVKGSESRTSVRK